MKERSHSSADSPQKVTIHQFHYHAAGEDAITNQMRFIRNSLHEAGIAGEVFAKEIKGTARSWVLPYNKETLWNSDLLLIHHSQENPKLDELLEIEVPKAIVYHNVTPADFFAHDPVAAELSRKGRLQLRRFKGKCDASFADSRFNRRELESQGIHHAEILPLFDLRDMPEVPPKATGANGSPRAPRVTGSPKQMGGKEGWHVLFVGRVAPHKNQAKLIETLYYLKALSPQSRLTLVGGEDRVYGLYLRDLVRHLDLGNSVRFAGKIPQEVLEECFASADTFLCLSQHEGFCIPLIEAMRRQLPVISTIHGAMRETLGEAGLQLQTENPKEVAAIIHTVLQNKEALSELRAGQRTQLKFIAETQDKKRVVGLLTSLVEQMRTHARGTPLHTKSRSSSHAPKETSPGA